MNPVQQANARKHPPFLGMSRRRMLQNSGMGLGALVLNHLLSTDNRVEAASAAGGRPEFDLRPKQPHRAPRAKSVILMMQNGGPSQMDLFDPKPALQKFGGKQHSIKVEMFQKGSEQNKLMSSPFKLPVRPKNVFSELS